MTPWPADRPVPAWITMALDMGRHEGPEVDIACGAREPDVDMWEAGLAVPSPEQVALLAELTGFPVEFFYKPFRVGPMSGPIFLCYRNRRQSVVLAPNVITEDGVLLCEGKPRPLPAGAQQALF